MYQETVTPELFEVLNKLMALETLAPFRLVGGTAISLQIGHRKSIDTDIFCNEQVSKQRIVAAIQSNFINTICRPTSYCINAVINNVKIDIYDEWSIPFKKPIVNQDGIRLADLEDLAVFKLTALTERREKKDYVDLYFLFKQFGGLHILEQHKEYNPLLSQQSILFALKEVDTAVSNKSVMPDMLVPFSWDQAVVHIKSVAKEYFNFLQKQQKK